MSITDNGYHYAVLSKFAYFDEDHGIAAYSELGYTNVKFISRENTQCYLMEDDSKIVVAVRGTEVGEASDIASDLNFFQRKSKTRGGVHDGFYSDANEIWVAVNDYISGRTKKVWFCGHSLGGAIATILASRKPMRVAACYTYGGPRVGNKRWVTHQGFSNHRFVNNNDIVPRLPPIWACYRHYGELHYINYYGNIRDLTAWQRFKDRIRGIRKAWSKGECFDSFRDHAVERYVEKLRDL